LVVALRLPVVYYSVAMRSKGGITRFLKSGLKLSSVGVATVRIDNNDPNRMYKDFWDWLFNDWHIIFLVGLVIGYFYYLITTTEA